MSRLLRKGSPEPFSQLLRHPNRVLTSHLLGARIRSNLAEQLIARFLFLRCPTEVRSLSYLKSPGNIRHSRPYRPDKFVLPRKGDTQ